MNEIRLSGLDGSNPLAFLAALGALVALTDAASETTPHAPTLHWVLDGVWRPVVRTHLPDLDTVLQTLDADRKACAASRALAFTYPSRKGPQEDVKAPPGFLADTLAAWADAATPSTRRDVDWFTAFVSEGAQDNNGAAKPTALHFTAGQQRFLKAAKALAGGADAGHLRTAVLGPWPYSSKLPVMGWDNTESRDYALRARNPSNDTKLGNPGADWLALRGLTCFPTAGDGSRQRTAGVRGAWKTGSLAWPLWERPATVPTAASVVATRDLTNTPPTARARRGICQVFRSRILRSDQGGYGSVTPAEVV